MEFKRYFPNAKCAIWPNDERTRNLFHILDRINFCYDTLRHCGPLTSRFKLWLHQERLSVDRSWLDQKRENTCATFRRATTCKYTFGGAACKQRGERGVDTHTHTRVPIHACVLTHTCVLMYARILNTHTLVYQYTHTPTYTHVHTHTSIVYTATHSVTGLCSDTHLSTHLCALPNLCKHASHTPIHNRTLEG